MSEKNESKVPVTAGPECSARLGVETGEALITEIEKILSGIDKTEIEDQGKGWSETSTGAVFGAEKLAEIKTAIRDHFK